MSEQKVSKDFKYTMKSKSSGRVLAEQVVRFGSNERPFPENWKDDPIIQKALHDHIEEFLASVIEIDIEEHKEENNEL